VELGKPLCWSADLENLSCACQLTKCLVRGLGKDTCGLQAQAEPPSMTIQYLTV